MKFTRQLNATTTAHRNSIRAAYTLADKKMPDRMTEVRNLILNSPTVLDVATQRAREAFETRQPDKFVKDTLAAVQEAQAAEALRSAFLRVEESIGKAHITDAVDTAVEAITQRFNREAREFIDAAQQLHPTRPLDAETAIALDAGDALTTARRALHNLGVFASIHGHFPSLLSHQELRSVLPIITLPTTVLEQVYRSLGEAVVTANDHELAGTRTVRTLANDLRADTDTALVRIAAGRYDGITFDLAKSAEHRERHTIATNAFNRRTIEKSGAKVTFI